MRHRLNSIYSFCTALALAAIPASALAQSPVKVQTQPFSTISSFPALNEASIKACLDEMRKIAGPHAFDKSADSDGGVHMSNGGYCTQSISFEHPVIIDKNGNPQPDFAVSNKKIEVTYGTVDSDNLKLAMMTATRTIRADGKLVPDIAVFYLKDGKTIYTGSYASKLGYLTSAAVPLALVADYLQLTETAGQFPGLLFASASTKPLARAPQVGAAAPARPDNSRRDHRIAAARSARRITQE